MECKGLANVSSNGIHLPHPDKGIYTEINTVRSVRLAYFLLKNMERMLSDFLGNYMKDRPLRRYKQHELVTKAKKILNSGAALSMFMDNKKGNSRIRERIVRLFRSYECVSGTYLERILRNEYTKRHTQVCCRSW